ncbi:hypothetical protein [Larkinella sp. C7]|jgi:hypothetical protein|uniref:hypothetical protein n=1 Tax=Larkinella sp. C7 TaxID=2576607 RepID=UPI0011114A2B|nr:hypothetical protein [Larkinella sp. C7]
MFPFWSTILFALLMVAGFLLLFKSIGKLIRVYTAGTKIEDSALVPDFEFPLKQPGAYEIAVKRPSLTGIIPTDIPFEMSDLMTGKTVAVHAFVNLLGQRKDGSGSRIIPIAEFTIEQEGRFKLINPQTGRFKERDSLIVMPKTGSQGFLMIFAVLFSAILFIGGLVLFILSLVKP